MNGVFRQCGLLLGAALPGVAARAGVLLPALLALAGVAAVLSAGMATSEGLRTTFLAGAHPHSAIALRRGASSELVSVLGPTESAALRSAPGVEALSEEMLLVVSLDTKEGGSRASVSLRGVGQVAYDIRENLDIVAGRRTRPGRNEIAVGTEAQRRYRGLELGAVLHLAGQAWPVVGVFETGGREDSELWGDRVALQSAYRRGASFQSVQLALESSDALAALQRHVEADPRLPLSVSTHTEYYAGQIEALGSVLHGVASMLVLLMSVGAILAGLDAGYAVLEARAPELATFRALGVPRAALLAALLVESTCLSALGAAAGVALTALLLDGLRASTLDFYAFTQVAFQFELPVETGLRAAGYATGVGVLGGLVPALQALRRPIAEGLRH